LTPMQKLLEMLKSQDEKPYYNSLDWVLIF